MRKINWNKILRYCSTNELEWRFNPLYAASSWWGGWERLIRLLKDLLKRTLRRTSLNYEESTVLCDCEAVMNSRPLTYLTEEPDETLTITPAMFIIDIRESGVPDLDQINRTQYARRLRCRQRLKEELRRRFRIQYLGQLARRSKYKDNSPQIKIGDIVLIENELQKRLDWPLAKVKEIFPGQDGNV